MNTLAFWEWFAAVIAIVAVVFFGAWVVWFIYRIKLLNQQQRTSSYRSRVTALYQGKRQ